VGWGEGDGLVGVVGTADCWVLLREAPHPIETISRRHTNPNFTTRLLVGRMAELGETASTAAPGNTMADEDNVGTMGPGSGTNKAEGTLTGVEKAYAREERESKRVCPMTKW
jgi:hypothetical protein